MHSYAQTNLQLFNQLCCEGYSSDELKCVANAYKLVVCLFTGQFRPSGKSFIEHLIGTASILGHYRATGNVVAAGLLHATYSHGDFGGFEPKGISDAKRKQVTQIVGKDVEEYVAKYEGLYWRGHTISSIYHRLDNLDPVDRDTLLIRLANELEEHLDLGLLYCGDSKHQHYVNHDSALITAMAEKLGFPALAVELETAFQNSALSKVPGELCNLTGEKHSCTIGPKSYRQRFLVTFNRSLHKLKQRRFS